MNYEPGTRVFSEARQQWGVVMLQNHHKGPEWYYAKFTPVRSGWHHESDLWEAEEVFAYCWDRHRAGQI
ncbi:hypothetical protein SAMN05421781_0532 [Marinococcus luteus]|uniref:Uncharacterized protein n=1 Tax=Marinococcus luteus TaxID=1122204 RepID=A0A1H2QZH0_9BACI|nr:hypothetical protein [Marinococcus luteus]SDW12612.1 hypothetical protein SAMN05421781_0532 [Marinococcus luteus]